MAITPGSRRRDTPTAGEPPRTDNTLRPEQDPLAPADRPASTTSDVNDVNFGDTGTRRTTTGLSTAEPRATRGFTTTFVIIAVVLLAAFLVALYYGAETYQATAPDAGAPVADAPATPGDATGSTTPVQPVQPVQPAPIQPAPVE